MSALTMTMNDSAFNPYGLRDGEMSSGTTIMAVTYDGGVILGADSRTSTGSVSDDYLINSDLIIFTIILQYVANRVADKIVPIHDYIWTCRSGSAADTQAVADYVKYYVDSHRYLNLILIMITIIYLYIVLKQVDYQRLKLQQI